MRPKPREALRRGRCAVLWESAVIGTGEARYFVQGLGTRRFDSRDFGSLPSAEQYFDDVEEAGPKLATGFGWREGFGYL